MSEPLSISSAAAFPRSRISHNAYWRVKEQCKRSGKPCLYMKHGGVAGLSRLIAPGEGNKAAKTLPVVQNQNNITTFSSNTLDTPARRRLDSGPLMVPRKGIKTGIRCRV